MMRIRLVSGGAVMFAALLSSHALAQRGGGGGGGGPLPPPEPERFQYVGPPSDGRIAAVTGVQGDTMTYYFGASSGGVWKSTDGAQTFAPIFDDQDVQSIGALRVAPSNSNIVWAGTGEAWAIRDADVMGDGVYKSEDAGKTWKHMGLVETGRIGRILINPRDPNIVYVCALGRATGPQEERGVYKTTDGGQTWTRSLFVNPNTGCSGISMDANDPNTLFAGTWEVVMHTWAMFSGGAGSGVYVTHDAGAHWTHLSTGLPNAPVGKIDVAVAPSDSKRVYALIQTASQGALWRSDDGGNAWNVVSWDRTLIGRAGYYIRIEVSPTNPDEVLISNSSFHRSTDGGKTFPGQGGGGCGDCHDIWMDPKNADHWIESGDASAGITTNHGRSFSSHALPIGQMYHVTTDNRYPYWIYSNRQDAGTMRGPNNAPVPVPNVPQYLESTGIAEGPMPAAGGGGRGGRGGGGGAGAGAAAAAGRGGRGGAGGAAAGGRGGRGGRAGGAGGAAAAAAVDTMGRGGVQFSDSALRQSTRVYVAAPLPVNNWQTNLGGCESGFTLPDLTNPDIVWASCYGNEVTRYDAKIGRARSVAPWIHTLDSPPNETKYRCHWTPPLAIDPFDHNTVYYGCQLVFKTSNGGQSWVEFSPDLSTKDPSKIVSSGGIIGDNLGQFYGEVVFAIAPSDAKRGLVWAGTNDGKLWYTKSDGIWHDVTKNIPNLPPWGTIRKIEPSHFDPATAYVAIDFHMMDNREPYIYKTTDYGLTWKNITSDLPRNHPLAYVMAITENPNRKGMLFVGTGNGFFYSMNDGAHWIQFKDGIPAAPVSWITVQKMMHDVVISTYGRGLFVMHDITRLEQSDKIPATAAAYLYAPRNGIREARSGTAEFMYELKSAPSGPVKLDVLDTAGTVLATINGAPGNVGLNRAQWDLRLPGPGTVGLRTTPPDNPHIWEEPRFAGRPTRPITHWGIEQAIRAQPISAPGKYMVRLTVDGKVYTQPFQVEKVQDISATDADLQLSTKTQVRIVRDMDTSVDLINKLEIMRKQIEDQKKAHASDAEDLKALDVLDAKLLATESRLLSRTDFYSDDKWYVDAYKVYMNLIWLYGEVGGGAGDVQGGAEYRPTDASLMVLTDIERQLTLARTEFHTLMTTTVPSFNKTMSGKLPPITDTM